MGCATIDPAHRVITDPVIDMRNRRGPVSSGVPGCAEFTERFGLALSGYAGAGYHIIGRTAIKPESAPSEGSRSAVRGK